MPGATISTRIKKNMFVLGPKYQDVCMNGKTTSSVMRRILLCTTWLALQPYMTGM
jgi:hypothetical protein